MALFKAQAQQQRQMMQQIHMLMEEKETRTPTSTPNKKEKTKLRRSPRKLLNKSNPRRASDVSSDAGAELEKTPSLSDELKGRKLRMRKSPEDQSLRNVLRVEMARLDNPLVNDEFHDASGKFDNDLFEDECRPIIANVLGEEGDGEDGEPLFSQSPLQAYRMCLDIAKKRRRYLLSKVMKRVKVKAKGKPTKRVNTKVKAKGKPTKRVNTKVKGKGKPTKRVKREPIAAVGHADGPFATIDVEAEEAAENERTRAHVQQFFDDSSQEDNDNDASSYDCMYCSTSLASIEDAYPESSRNDGTVLFKCENCWKQSTEFLRQVNEGAQEARKVEKARLQAFKTKKTAVTGVTQKKTAVTGVKQKKTLVFDLHENVLAKWPKTGGWYQAQVFGRRAGKYNVYFPEDDEVLRNCVPTDLKHPPTPLPNWAKMTRVEFLTMRFRENIVKKKGRKNVTECVHYQIIKFATGKNINKYVCRNDTSGETKLFPAGYVQKKVLHEIFPLDKTFIENSEF